MIQIQSIDIRGLQFLIGGLQNALIGSGADCSNIVRDESRMLAIEIANRVGPRNRSKSAKNIPREIGKVFMAAPVYPWGRDKSGDGNGLMTWLNAGPDFLTGIESRNYRPDVNDMVWMERTFIKNMNGMGKKYMEIGQHYHQHVKTINRIMVKRGTFARFVIYMVSHLGRMKASWLATAKKLDPALVAPGWIARHIPNNPKAITQIGGLDDAQHPSVTFGSSALGITKQQKQIAVAVEIRKHKVLSRLRLVLSGYSKDVANGIRPRRHAKDYHADT